ncbi:MAG: folate-binding protein YgfZ [Solirubrobacterales bacterium]|nr:folate-binding protein YgfZ [Solirubrobacterales bacterium]
MAETAPLDVELDAQYRALREEAGVLERAERALVAVEGPDAAEFLQGQVTNESEKLEAGEGRYAALLDRKGHIQADMRMLRLGDGEFWIESEAGPGAVLLKHLSMYKIGREVEVADRSAEHALVSLLGPRSRELAGAAVLGDEHEHTRVEIGGASCLAVATDLGIDLLTSPTDAAAVRASLLDAGAEEVSAEAAELARVESGRPRFGREMGPETMPAEAGIVERAVNFEKGCYIGQEPVARLHYRGRPNRVLRGLKVSAGAEPGEAVANDDRELGAVATVAVSPRLGPIALAVLRREAEPGDKVKLAGGGEAEVLELPFADG